MSAGALDPDAIVSIDADGGPPKGRWFHVNYSTRRSTTRKPVPPYDCASHARSVDRRSGVQPSTYRGSDGLYGSADLAGLNLAQYPSVLIEMGNAEEAAVPSVSA